MLLLILFSCDSKKKSNKEAEIDQLNPEAKAETTSVNLMKLLGVHRLLIG